MYSSNHSTLFYLILARTLGGQNSYRGKSVSLGRFMSKSEGKKTPLLERKRKGNIVSNICLNMNKHTNDLESRLLE